MILRKMDELGYVPSSNARRLISGRSLLVGLWDTADEIGPFTHEVMRVLLRLLTPRDYDLLHHREGNGEEQHLAMTRRTKSRVTDSTIVLGYGIAADLVAQLASPRHPFVGIDVKYEDDVPTIPHLASILIDHIPGFRQVAQLLRDYGHTHIGYVCERHKDGTTWMFRNELEAVGLGLDGNDILGYGYDPDNGAQAFAELMSRPVAPTAIFFRRDSLAIGALYQAMAMGIRVPEDVSIVGHDDLPLPVPGRQSLTTVNIDVEKIGRLAVDAAFELLDDPHACIPTQQLSGSLVERQTVGPAPKRRGTRKR